MIPGAFSYHRPATVADAVKLLADLGDDARADPHVAQSIEAVRGVDDPAALDEEFFHRRR